MILDATPDEMARELGQGPEAVESTLREARRQRAELDALIARAGRIVLVGTGASLAMARAAAPLWRAGSGAMCSCVSRRRWRWASSTETERGSPTS